MAHEFVLPSVIVSSADLTRLQRELGNIDDSLLQLKLRSPGDKIALPSIGSSLQQVVDANKINLLQEAERANLAQSLSDVISTAPTMHISFSAEADGEMKEKLVTWFRSEIHPYALLTIGLMPNIGAGLVLRSTNKYFDLSLKQAFARSREKLAGSLNELLKPESLGKL